MPQAERRLYMENEKEVVSYAYFSESHLYEAVTQKYIETHKDKLLDERVCSMELLKELNSVIDVENAPRDKSEHFKKPKNLPLVSIAMLIAAREDMALVAGGDKSGNNQKSFMTTEKKLKLPIGKYQYDDSNNNKGVWEITNNPHESFGVLVEHYKPGATKKEKDEVYSMTKGRLRIIYKCTIPHYAIMNNCIYDVLNKKMIDFTPELVFTAKSHVNFNPSATNPFIPVPEDNSVWDVDSWLDSLGTPEFVGHIKEVLQAVLLPLVKRNQSVWFYSPVGNNGKGTIAQLLRNLVHEEVTVNIPLSQFAEDFGLAKLPGAMAVITDENDVHTFKSGEGMGRFKAVVTGDAVTIHEKYVNPYTFHFNGLVVECCNSFVKTNDSSNSFYRRLHIIPFSQCFTGAEKRYIKDRLIYRTDVLEYLAKMVLCDMEYRDSFTETPMTQKTLSMYISNTNYVAEYLDEILPVVKWNLLPAKDFLYAGFQKFYQETNPSGKVCGRTHFINSVKDYISKNPDWEWTDSCRSKGYIDPNVVDPLIFKYDMDAFINRMYMTDRDYDRKCPLENCLKEKYSGLKRKNVALIQNNPDDEETE